MDRVSESSQDVDRLRSLPRCNRGGHPEKCAPGLGRRLGRSRRGRSAFLGRRQIALDVVLAHGEHHNLERSHAPGTLHEELHGLARRLVSFLDGLVVRSEEHTSELQSLAYLVCRLLLEKKKTLTDVAAQR